MNESGRYVMAPKHVVFDLSDGSIKRICEELERERWSLVRIVSVDRCQAVAVFEKAVAFIKSASKDHEPDNPQGVWCCQRHEEEFHSVKRERYPRPTGCICPMFQDTGGFRIADLACPVHGVGGSDPGDGYW